MKEIEKMPDADKIMELPISYEKRGMEKGIEKGIEKVAREMLQKGMSMDLIANVTHLEKEEIKKLQESL